MPPRPGRRGKGPRDQSMREENAMEPPSKLLSAVLKTLNLTFERDIGMLNGKNVRSIPTQSALFELQGQLEKLRSSVEAVAVSDQKTIETLRKIRDGQTQQIHKEEEKVTPEERTASVTLDDAKKNNALKPEENMPSASKEQEDQASSNDEADSKEILFVPKRRKRSLGNDEDDIDNKEVIEGASSNDKMIPANKKLKTEAKERSTTEKIENDPSVKNPKSEFVVSQTLPLAAAALGLFNEEGLKNTGEDYLKKKYDVASYPTDDLKELLPGELPDMDFSHPKPTNQIQFNTFLSSIENIFRELNDEDIKFLKNKYIMPMNLQVDKTYDPEVTPYIIPKLGPLYAETWSRQDNNQNLGNTSPPSLNDPSSILPRRSAADITDSTLETEEVSCGPLVSRLLSAILRDECNEETIPSEDSANNMNLNGNQGHQIKVKEENKQDLTKSSTNDDDDNQERSPYPTFADAPVTKVEDSNTLVNGSTTSTTSTLPNRHLWKFNAVNIDYPTFEERLKRELKFVGIYINLPKDENNPNGDDPDWLTGREDDEISAELRELQSSLKQVTVKNQKRKTALIPLVDKRLAWQEYSSILDDLDKQVDQAYIKRIRVPKKRKKHHTSVSSVVVGNTSSQAAQQKAANSSLKALLDKRQRWISKIGPLFDKPEIMKRMPKESVFKDIDQEEEEEETDVFGHNGNGKEDELTET